MVNSKRIDSISPGVRNAQIGLKTHEIIVVCNKYTKRLYCPMICKCLNRVLEWVKLTLNKSAIAELIAKIKKIRAIETG